MAPSHTRGLQDCQFFSEALPISKKAQLLKTSTRLEPQKQVLDRLVPSSPSPSRSDIRNIYNLVTYSASLFGHLPAIGTRPSHNFGRRGPYQYQSYDDYKQLVDSVGSGLRHVGLTTGDKIHIYGGTSPNWLACAHGAASQSMPFVTAYEALGAEGLSHSLHATAARAVFVDEGLLTTLSEAMEMWPLANLQVVICNRGAALGNKDSCGLLQGFRQRHCTVVTLTFDELCQSGRELGYPPRLPEEEDLCGIFYTSGSENIPKGVPVKHKAVISAVMGLDSVLGKHLSPQDKFLAYLPLAHVLEFAFENSCLLWGTPMGYGTPKTLFDSPSRGDFLGDLRALQPSFMIGVPLIWEKVKRLINDKAASAGLKEVAEFEAAVERRLCDLKSGKKIELVANVLPAAEAVVGSRIRFAMTGGGPIASSTQDLLSAVVAPLVNGYGMTETMAIGGLLDPEKWRTGCLGRIPSAVDMKLVDVPQLGYLTTSQPPQGEIYLRGPSVLEEYYRNPIQTAGVLTDDGWLKTGDVGESVGEDYFKIIDRVKNLVKSLSGEYIALEKIESVYRSSPLVSNICAYASPLRAKPVAIVIPAPGSAQGGSSSGTLAATLLEQLKELARDAGLVSMEVVEGVVIADELEWTPQNGMTTAVGKLNRTAILKKYQEKIDFLLANLEKPGKLTNNF